MIAAPRYLARAQEIAAVIESAIVEHIHLRPLLLQYPRDIITLTSHGFDLPVIFQPSLSVNSAARYLCVLSGRDASHVLPLPERRLWGLLHVGQPANLILLDNQMSDRMKNYVVAHELGHFVGDLLLVRQQWLNQLSDERDEVLRAFQWQAYDGLLDLQAVIRGLPPRPSPILGRGQFEASETWSREIQADLVARELLAPWDKVVPQIAQHSWQECEILLRQDFGLPASIARHYADEIRNAYEPPPDLITRLFG